MAVQEFGNGTILLEVIDGVATVTMNRPEMGNAISPEMGNAKRDVMLSLEADEKIRAIVVTGAGRHYCTGIDLAAGGSESFGAKAHGQTAEEKATGVDAETIAKENAFWTWRTPIIAAINGAAIGAGLTVPLLYDVRFAAEDAKLAFNFSRLGIIAEANSSWLVPRLVGLGRGLELLLSGRMFSGKEAAEIGLVNHALPKEEVLPAAQAFARELATSTSAVSVAVIKRLVHEFQQQTDRHAAFVKETDMTWWVGSQPDAKEGPTAFLEKRAPTWGGSKHVAIPDELA